MKLVTGGAGFIGSHLVDELLKDYKVKVVDNLSRGSYINKQSIFYKQDISKDRLDFSDVDTVFHLAAQIDVRKSLKDPLSDAKTNLLGLINVLEHMRKYDVKKIVFTSSGGAIYGSQNILPVNELAEQKPLSPYGTAKLCSEEYIKLYNRLYGIDYTILRLANVYGPRQNPKLGAGIISILLYNLLHNKQVIIYDGSQTRDYVYVSDVIRALIMSQKWKGIFNIGSGKETSVNHLCNMIVSKFNFDKKTIVYKPEINGEVKRICLDISKSKQHGWAPKVGLEEGILRTYNWIKEVV